jgi:predicted RNA-binding Zn ribbon-like protein
MKPRKAPEGLSARKSGSSSLGVPDAGGGELGPPRRRYCPSLRIYDIIRLHLIMLTDGAIETVASTAEDPIIPNDRFRLSPAPAGLRFVQDLVNTALAAPGKPSRPDLLADLGSARSWLSDALGAWSAATGAPAPAIELDEQDLAPLRDHREHLRAALRAAPGGATAASVPGPGSSRDIAARVLLTVSPDGGVRYEPLESGWRAVRALTSAETLLAGAAGTRPRLKTCAYPPCGVCFYDSSPNRTRVWHDTKTCGNVTNLRASRSRRTDLTQ